MGFLSDLKKITSNLLMLDEYLFNTELRQRIESQAIQRDYYTGDQRKQLTVRSGQADDNLTLNFARLIVERSVSMLLGEGVEFELPGEQEGANNQYIDEVWQANKKDILLHKAAQFGGINGTCYLKIIPDGAESKINEGVYVPRLVPLDPMHMTIETSPEDIDYVERYVMRFNIVMNEQDTARKEVTERMSSLTENEDGSFTQNPDSWLISNYYANSATGGKWALLYDPQPWEYEFPPIIHWQNLPAAWDVYGQPDMSGDLIQLQDRINFIASNISKIIRYHAHPKTWGRNVGSGTSQKQSWGADEMIVFSGDNAMIDNLEMQSDLMASQQYLLNLRQSLFDITRTVDITSMSDKLGALTNFGLRVLFMDALAKLNTKKELYGEALSEANHRLLVLREIEPNDGGRVIWPDTMTTDEQEEVNGLTFDLQQGLVSKQSASIKRGYDWENEQELMQEEQAAGDNVGAAILRAFERGG